MPDRPAIKELEPFQRLVIEEREQLSMRIENLKNFVVTQTFDELDKEEQKLLSLQLVLMARYCDVLDERISAFA